MNKRILTLILIVTMALQAGFLIFQVVSSELTGSRGQEFVFRIGGYDPVDPLRGRYLIFELRDINMVSLRQHGLGSLPENSTIWVRLKKDDEGFSVIESYSLSRKTGLGWIPLQTNSSRRVIPPVSRFYINEQDALVAENLLLRSQDGAVVVRYRQGTFMVSSLTVGGVMIHDAVRQATHF